jgi:hypothetical protein
MAIQPCDFLKLLTFLLSRGLRVRYQLLLCQNSEFTRSSIQVFSQPKRHPYRDLVE